MDPPARRLWENLSRNDIVALGGRLTVKVITITREYGAGGGEVARRLAEALGWELLDHALLHQAAELEHLPDSELEQWDEKAISMADRFRLHPPHERYIHGLTEATHQAAARGNVVLVGRGTRQLLGATADAFHLRLVAPRSWRVERMAARENWSAEQATARCLEVDRTRERFIRYFFGSTALQSEQYDIVANTGRMPLEDVVSWVLATVRNDWGSTSGATESGRVLTLSRQIGAGESGFAPTLAARTTLRHYDRELLEREAGRLGVSVADLQLIDEQPAGIFQRFRPGSLHQRYFLALQQLMSELAREGEVLLVGRGGSRLLRDHPRAFHVRLVAPHSVRFRRVMEYRWLAEEAARSLISDSDSQRQRFYEDYFGADWSDPLEYDATVNSGRLEETAAELIAFAAERFWLRGRQSGRGLDSE
jgi:cytidylate kinase